MLENVRMHKCHDRDCVVTREYFFVISLFIYININVIVVVEFLLLCFILKLSIRKCKLFDNFMGQFWPRNSQPKPLFYPHTKFLISISSASCVTNTITSY